MTRFFIRWHDGPNARYTVSIPSYNGGEVVVASDYDALKAEIAALRSALKKAKDALEMIRDNPRAMPRIIADKVLALPAVREEE